jgi:chaperone modulatory protein CbpM
MISIEILVARLPGLQRPHLERWIANGWVRPDGAAGRYAFREIDVARVRLIQQLRDDLDVAEDALPIVLSLLDQLYDARRRVRELYDALGRTAPEDVRRKLADDLAKRPRPTG